jgi:hypothetical protein
MNLVFLVFVRPDVLASGAEPGCGDPFLFSVHRVFMAEQPHKFQGTVRAFAVVRVLVVFAAYLIHQGVGGDRVDIVAAGAVPGRRYPFPFPFHCFVLVQPHCFGAALRAFLFYGSHHLAVILFVPTSCAGFKRYLPSECWRHKCYEVHAGYIVCCEDGNEKAVCS